MCQTRLKLSCKGNECQPLVTAPAAAPLRDPVALHFAFQAAKVGRCRLTLLKPKLKPPGTKRLKLEYDGLLSNFGFKFNLRRYTKGLHDALDAISADSDRREAAALATRLAGPCNSNWSKRRLVSALETIIWMNCFQLLCSN